MSTNHSSLSISLSLSGHKLDRVGSGGVSSAPKALHVPARPPSSSGKHKSGSLENSGGSGSEGDNRAAEEEGKGGRSHTHRGDQEAPPKRYVCVYAHVHVLLVLCVCVCVCVCVCAHEIMVALGDLWYLCIGFNLL